MSSIITLQTTVLDQAFRRTLAVWGTLSGRVVLKITHFQVLTPVLLSIPVVVWVLIFRQENYDCLRLNRRLLAKQRLEF